MMFCGNYEFRVQMNSDSQSKRVQDFLSPEDDLFVIAKKNSIGVFRLEKRLINMHQHEELNDTIKFAQEILLSKMPEFVRKEISK